MIITFEASAADPQDGALIPTCLPESGSRFAVGSTPVTCIATDSAGNVGVASLDVVVIDGRGLTPTTIQGAAPSTPGDQRSYAAVSALLAFAGAASMALGSRHRRHQRAMRRRARRRALAANLAERSAQSVYGSIDVREFVDTEQSEAERREALGLVNR